MSESGDDKEELRWLRRRVADLEEEREIARRLAAFDEGPAGRERTYRFVRSESVSFSVARLCQVCGVARSAYYDWLGRQDGPGQAVLEEAYLANRIFDIWRRSRRRYGAPRVTAALGKQGVEVNEKRVARLMAELGIAGKCGRRKIRTTWRDPAAKPAADLVERDFTADEPDELWVGDITYIPTDEGWLFVADWSRMGGRRSAGYRLAVLSEFARRPGTSGASGRGYLGRLGFDRLLGGRVCRGPSGTGCLAAGVGEGGGAQGRTTGLGG